MSENHSTVDDAPLSVLERVNAVCNRFEDAWLAGQRPRIEDYLVEVSDERERDALLQELIALDVFHRRRAGEDPQVEEYRGRFPDLAATPSLVDRTPLSTPLLLSRDPGRPLPCVPSYEILEELVGGGMGEVYKAWQSGPNRVVALKMMKRSLLQDRAGRDELLERFRVEVEALGRLQHPNIVVVHEAGEQDGRPYLVMEFVEGGSLDKMLEGTPLAARPAAELVETLARAVHHAHQRGILHRDLKPANVLLASGGRQPPDRSEESGGSRPPLAECTPKITDFGLAKFLKGGGAGLTDPGMILGTPSYMAPEQATGREVGPAADIYALGAILYECLTGRPPFQGSSVMETLDLVRMQEPVAVHLLNPKVPRDLQTICLKCLEKDPASRYYDSALALADDLRRFLDGSPIKARPPSAWGRTVKWARRQPVAAALVGAITVVVLVVAAAGWWHSAQMKKQRQTAEDNFRLALAAMDEMLTEVGAVDLADVPQMEPVRKKLLHRALPFFEQFLAKLGNDPAVRHEEARAYSLLGDVLALLRKQEEAEHAYRQALDLLDQDSGQPAGANHRREQAKTWGNLGVLLKERKRFKETEAALVQASQLWGKLAAERPDEPDYQEQVAASWYHLGTVLARQAGRENKAEQAYQEALRRQQPLAQKGQRPDSLRSLARTFNNLGLLWQNMGKGKDAERAFQNAIDIQEGLVKKYPEVPAYRRELARSYNNRGELRAKGQPAAALKDYSDAEKRLEHLMRDFPKVPAYRLEWSAVQINLGNLWQDKRRLRDAEAAFRKALQARKEVVEKSPGVSDHHHKLAEAHRRLGILLKETGRSDEAEKEYQEALRIGRELLDRHPDESE
jgi:eukaryotic-like serine/threonine-protein kinase